MLLLILSLIFNFFKATNWLNSKTLITDFKEKVFKDKTEGIQIDKINEWANIHSRILELSEKNAQKFKDNVSQLAFADTKSTLIKEFCFKVSKFSATFLALFKFQKISITFDIFFFKRKMMVFIAKVTTLAKNFATKNKI